MHSVASDKRAAITEDIMPVQEIHHGRVVAQVIQRHALLTGLIQTQEVVHGFVMIGKQSSEGTCINTGSFLGSCKSASAGCKWTGTITTCTTQASGACVDGTETLTYSCWGPGDTPTPMPSYGNIAIAPSVGVPFASTASGILSPVLGYMFL